jgi:hypothetical protein
VATFTASCNRSGSRATIVIDHEAARLPGDEDCSLESAIAGR